MPNPATDWPRFTWPNYLATLNSFVGTVERPPRSNCQPLGREFGFNCVAWCAITVCVACNRLGFPLHTAAVIEVERLAKNGWMGLRWVANPVVGSLPCFGFAGGDPTRMHIGCCYEVLGRGSVGTAFRTIEGNASDRCDRWLRDEKFTRGFVVLPFAGTGPTTPRPPPPPLPEDDDMKVHLYEAADGNDVVAQGAVLIIPEELPLGQKYRPVPNEAWFRDALGALVQSDTKQVAPPPGTQSKYWADRGILNVQRVSAEFLRPFVS